MISKLITVYEGQATRLSHNGKEFIVMAPAEDLQAIVAEFAQDIDYDPLMTVKSIIMSANALEDQANKKGQP